MDLGISTVFEARGLWDERSCSSQAMGLRGLHTLEPGHGKTIAHPSKVVVTYP